MEHAFLYFKDKIKHSQLDSLFKFILWRQKLPRFIRRLWQHLTANEKLQL